VYGIPKDLDLSFFAGKRLDQVSFAAGMVFIRFDDKVEVRLESTYQHQSKQDIDHFRTGTMQSVPVRHSSTLMQAVGHYCVSASGDDEGTLTLEFDDGQVIRCIEERTPYESYEIINGDDEWVV
jgi:hypothetical protein